MSTLKKRQFAAPFICALIGYKSTLKAALADCLHSYFLNTKLFSRNQFLLRFYSLTNRLSGKPPINDIQSNADNDAYLAAISFCLREPIGRTKGILQDNSVFQSRIDSLRNSQHSSHVLTKHRDSMQILQRNNFLQLQNDLQHSRIISAFHFGDFVYGLNALMCLENPQNKRVLVSQDLASETYFDNIRTCFGDRAVLGSNHLIAANTDVLQLRKLLRSKLTTLTMFCDLPQRFGESTQVSFLARKAYFPKGPATLALATKAPLLPVITYRKKQKNFVKVFPLIVPEKLEGETLEQAVTRITQSLVNILEAYLEKYPQQWKYLRLLPDYFHNPT
ncbi:MAG: hypothetical protein GKR91_15885 [Pseudomonadales bacterium]|nr:hypothetical protein [Pseudomonadales bacterium]